MATIRFSGRKPIPEKVRVGMEGEHNAEELVFVNLPEIDDSQVETLEIIAPDGSADAVALTDHKAKLTATHTQYTGILTAYVQVQKSTDVIWKSEKIFLEILDLPDIDTAISQAYPTAIATALSTAGGYVLDAEAWAKGTRNGTAVGSSDATYHKNAKYYADNASGSATTAGNAAADAVSSAEDAEAWAKGTRNGSDVAAGDDAYHNNAYYYSELAFGFRNVASSYATQAANSKSDAEAFAAGTRNGTPVTSGDLAYNNFSKYYRNLAYNDAQSASSSKTAAANSAKDAEAFAAGTRAGTAVTSGDDAYQNNAKYYKDQAASEAEDAEAWAKGTRGGTAVTSGDPAYQNSAKYWKEAAETAVTNIVGMTATATTLDPGDSATASYSAGVLTIGVPKGEKGDTGQTGQTGQTGATGATPNLTVGTVTTGAAGTQASATITGSAENPVLNLTIPRGDKGDVPSFAIGAVNSGSSPAASISGSDASPVLNLTLPKGDTGADGADGVSPTATVTKTGGTATITLTDTNGTTTETVSDGVTPSFSIGTVTTGNAGTSASATITGTDANPVLNLTIPRGSDGGGVPNGGTTGQALIKNSNTDQDVKWGAVDALPSGGYANQVLKKNNANSAAEWAGYAVPSGGSTNEVLVKKSGTAGDTKWAGFAVPSGGSTGQVLSKANNADGNTQWAGYAVPTGGSSGQVLAKNSSTNGDLKWTTVSGGASSLGQLSDVDTSGAWRGFEALVYNGSVWYGGAPTMFTYIDDDGNGNPCMPDIENVYAAFSVGYRILAEDYLADELTYYVVTNMEENDDGNGDMEHVCEVTRIKANGKIVKRVFAERYDSNSGDYVYTEETPSGMVSNIEMITQAMYDAKALAGTLDGQTLYCIKEN